MPVESAPSLTPAAAALGDWIGPRLGPFDGRVSCVVPRGYAAYARVLHPVGADDGQQATTWAGVCAVTGATAHALMQWRCISIGWPGDDVPDEGNLHPSTLARLLAVLRPYTHGEVIVALWDGWGWVDGGGVLVIAVAADGPLPARYVDPEPGANDPAALPHPDGAAGSAASPARPGLAPTTRYPPPPPDDTPVPGVYQQPAAYDAATLAAPRLHLPHRDHLVFTGPLVAVPTLGHHTPHAFWPQSPTLLWPTDRSWFVGTEVDFDSTVVAGPQTLIDTVLAADGIEAWPVDPEDDLSWVGDRVNPAPPDD